MVVEPGVARLHLFPERPGDGRGDRADSRVARRIELTFKQQTHLVHRIGYNVFYLFPRFDTKCV
jgi:hypothetical protein